jgi:hypothetical protein
MGAVDWIEVALDRDRWRALVNAVMNILLQKTCILRTDDKYDATWHHCAGKG